MTGGSRGKAMQEGRSPTATASAEWHGRNVLVTGGAGFIGSHVAGTLSEAGANVTILDNLQAGSRDNVADYSGSLALREGDVRDENLVSKILRETRPSHVLHLAANASVPGSVENPVYDFRSNCVGTFVVLDAVRTVCPETRVVVASSGAVYGEPSEFPLTEDSPVAPISPYGASKLGAEVESRIYQSVYGLPVVIGRIFNTYGIRMPRFVVFDFLKKLQADPSRLEILGSGQQVRDLNDVSDTVNGLLTLATAGVPGEAYNIASGSSCTVTEIAERLLRVLQLEGTSLHYTGESWSGDAQHWEVDVTKLRALGYEPGVPLDDGLARVAAWFDARHGRR